MNLINLLSEAAESELGLEIKSPEAQRLRENLHRQIELLKEPHRSEFHGVFLISTAPYDPELVLIIRKDKLDHETLLERGGLIEQPGWKPRGKGSVPIQERHRIDELEIDFSVGSAEAAEPEGAE